MPSAAAHHSSAFAAPAPAFGRFELRRLLGKSEATMAWLAFDSASQLEAMLTMPRVAPASAAGVADWLVDARRAARLDHPNLAPVLECGVHESWPFIAVSRGAGITLDEWLSNHRLAPVDEGAEWLSGVLRGLAFAHDAGVAHHDLQYHNILINERGQACVMALAVASGGVSMRAGEGAERRRGAPIDTAALRAQRRAAERDVLACGLVLHRMLSGEPALGQADIGAVIERMAPRGREFVRLPWTTPQPIPEALRAIVNRSTAGQERLRYRSARTFSNALKGWRESIADASGGPVALLIDRLRTVGHLPALPGLSSRVQRVTAIESQRTDEIARNLLPDIGLSLELLRMLNTAQVQGTQIAANGAVLTLRRIVSLIGVNGVRQAANSLRQWPGPLDEAHAAALRAAIDRVRLAGHTAEALRPAGYDGEVVYLITVLQNLGRLLLRYHFAEEAEQIDLLMQPTPPDVDPELQDPPLSEKAASFAVLGVDVETFGTAVARHWGLGDDVLHMIRRLPADAAVRKPDADADVLRIVASAANEAVDAVHYTPAAKLAAAIGNVAQRYAKVLRINAKAVSESLQQAREIVRKGLSAAPRARPGSSIESVANAPEDSSPPAEKESASASASQPKQ